MKNQIFLVLFTLCSLCGSSHGDYDPIRITDDIELIKISDNSFVHVSYINNPDYGRISANGLIFIDHNEAFLFDTPWTDSLTMVLVNYMETDMGLKIKGFIPNHWHEDCMGGLAYINSHGIESFAISIYALHRAGN